MTLSANLTYLAAVLLGAIFIAIPLAFLINRLWWNRRPIWKAVESPGDGFKLHERPSNVAALVRKPIPKSAPKSAA